MSGLDQGYICGKEEVFSQEEIVKANVEQANVVCTPLLSYCCGWVPNNSYIMYTIAMVLSCVMVDCIHISGLIGTEL